MCERLMGSIDLLKASRGAYTSKAGFDVHSTTRHSVADPFHDQLKGAWFPAGTRRRFDVEISSK
jgi:hypothetical protein